MANRTQTSIKDRYRNIIKAQNKRREECDLLSQIFSLLNYNTTKHFLPLRLCDCWDYKNSYAKTAPPRPSKSLLASLFEDIGKWHYQYSIDHIKYRRSMYTQSHWPKFFIVCSTTGRNCALARTLGTHKKCEARRYLQLPMNEAYMHTKVHFFNAVDH